MRGDTAEQLREAINPRVYASDPIASHHVALAREGSKLDIARQIYQDRAKLEPLPLPELVGFSRTEVIEQWRKGAAIPDESKAEFAGWLANRTMRSKALSANEQRLRASMDAQRTLAQSEQEVDRRMALALARWHREHWQLADVPMWAPAGQDQPFELQLMAAVRRRMR